MFLRNSVVTANVCINNRCLIACAFIFILLQFTSTTYSLLSNNQSFVVHPLSISITHLTFNMVHNAVHFVLQSAHNSLEKPRTKLVISQQFMNTKLQDKNATTPLMAQPYEVVNVTSGCNDGAQGVNKPPDKPNG